MKGHLGRSRGAPPAGLTLSRDQTHPCGEPVHRTRFIQTSSKRGSARSCDSPPRPCVLPSAIRAAPSSDLPVLDPSPSPSWSSAPGRANKKLSQFRFHHCPSPPGGGEGPATRLSQSADPSPHPSTHSPTQSATTLPHGHTSTYQPTQPPATQAVT